MSNGLPKSGSRIRLRKDVLASLMVALFIIGVFFGVAVYHFHSSSQTGKGGEVPDVEGSRERSVSIVSVRSDGMGLMGTLTAEVVPGDGRIWVDTEPLVGFDFQYADRTAVEVAADFTGLSMDEDDVGIEGTDIHFIVSAPVPGEVKIQAVDGPSAGAAAAIATIAALENKMVRDNVVITGSITPEGSIGVIGGVAAKASAAENAGMELFLVPEGQHVTVYERWGLFTIQRQKPISYLQQYAENNDWTLQIQEVPDIEEAADLMLY